MLAMTMVNRFLDCASLRMTNGRFDEA